MKPPQRTLFAGLATFFLGVAPQAAADPIVVRATFLGEDGKPLASLPVRIVVGSEDRARSPRSGKDLTTSSDGSLAYSVEAPVKKRSIRLDSIFARHPSRLIEVGVELELLGHRALYWIELDLVKAGPLAGMSALLPGADGEFDRPLEFDSATHSWAFPDAPQGPRLTGIGARLVSHEMEQRGDGSWAIDLVIEKQTFQSR